jgi:hypothetical protein
VNMPEEEDGGMKKELSVPYLVRFGVKSGKINDRIALAMQGLYHFIFYFNQGSYIECY